MPALPVVPVLDVEFDRSSCLRSGSPGAFGFELDLDRSEEALDDGIVPAVALAAHARRNAKDLEKLRVFSTCELTAAIGVDQQIHEGALVQRRAQRILCQRGVWGASGCPAHNLPRETVDHH